MDSNSRLKSEHYDADNFEEDNYFDHDKSSRHVGFFMNF